MKLIGKIVFLLFTLGISGVVSWYVYGAVHVLLHRFDPPSPTEVSAEVSTPEIFAGVGGKLAVSVDPWGPVYDKLTEWGVEQVVIILEDDDQTCLFWARWEDGRELCVPPEPPEWIKKPANGTLFFQATDSGCGLWIWSGGEKINPASGDKPCPR